MISCSSSQVLSIVVGEVPDSGVPNVSRFSSMHTWSVLFFDPLSEGVRDCSSVHFINRKALARFADYIHNLPDGQSPLGIHIVDFFACFPSRHISLPHLIHSTPLYFKHEKLTYIFPHSTAAPTSADSLVHHISKWQNVFQSFSGEDHGHHNPSQQEAMQGHLSEVLLS